jgi:hypothetical protein
MPLTMRPTGLFDLNKTQGGTVRPNLVMLDLSQPEVAILVVAMLQARSAVGRRSWSHPQEPTSEEWWGGVLADPRARRREQRASDLPLRRPFYTLADEKRETILVGCSKCDWKAAFQRDELITSHGRDYPMPNLLDELAARAVHGSAHSGIAAGCITSSRSRGRANEPGAALGRLADLIGVEPRPKNEGC